MSSPANAPARQGLLRQLSVLLEAAAQETRYALRRLRRSPGFTAVAILTLALGVGANTAIFTLLDALVLRNLPVPHPEELVRFGAYGEDDSYTALSLPMFQEISRSQNVFSSTFAWSDGGVVNVEANGLLSRSLVFPASGNYFSEFGAAPRLGRLITPADVNIEFGQGAHVVVLGYDFWQRQFGGAPDAIGKILKIEGLPLTIIGVAPERFSGISAEVPPELIVPLTLVDSESAQKELRRPDVLWIEAAARLKRGVKLEQARAELESLWPAIRAASVPPRADPVARENLLSLHLRVDSGAKGGSMLRARFAKPLYMLLAIGAVLLVLTSVNVAALNVARSVARNRELSVRSALGASRGRLVAQMLTESLTISFAGTIAGCLLASWASIALANFVQKQLYIVPAQLNLSMDWRILAFSAFAAVLAGAASGLIPAWRAGKRDVNESLQQTLRSVASGSGSLGKKLIVIEVALTVTLLASAGLFLRSVGKLRSVNPGFRTRELLQVDLFPRPHRQNDKDFDFAEYYHRLTDQVSSLPGVISAGLLHTRIGNVLEWTESVRIRGIDKSEQRPDFDLVMPGFFQAAGIELLRGRTFDWQDDAHHPSVAIVTRSFAERMFPGANSIGSHFDVTSVPKWQNLEVVGIVSDTSLYNMHKSQPPTVYLPSMQYADYMGSSEMLVHTAMPPAMVASSLRSVVDSFGHQYVTSIRTIRQELDRSIFQERVTAMLAAFFGFAALLLGAVGLYGLMAYNVRQRIPELGVRLALGATGQSIHWMVLRETVLLALTGISIGLPCALALNRVLANLVFGIAFYDPVNLSLVIAVLITVAICAGYFPARQAMRVDPIVALRSL